MPEPVMRAVSYPSKLLFAPYKIGAIVLALNCTGMVFLISMFKVNPLYCVLFAIGCHIALIGVGEKEPHLTNVLRAWSYGQRRTKNIIKLKKGNKFVP
jgi:hypothetical protein